MGGRVVCTSITVWNSLVTDNRADPVGGLVELINSVGHRTASQHPGPS